MPENPCTLVRSRPGPRRPLRRHDAFRCGRRVGRAAGLLPPGLGVPARQADPRARPIAVPLPRGIAATAALALALARLADGLARPSAGNPEAPLAAILAAPGVAPVSARPNHRQRAQRPYTALARRAGPRPMSGPRKRDDRTWRRAGRGDNTRARLVETGSGPPREGPRIPAAAGGAGAQSCALTGVLPSVLSGNG